MTQTRDYTRDHAHACQIDIPRWDLGAKTGSNKQFCVEMAQNRVF